jgi:hypothetical protein
MFPKSRNECSSQASFASEQFVTSPLVITAAVTSGPFDRSNVQIDGVGLTRAEAGQPAIVHISTFDPTGVPLFVGGLPLQVKEKCREKCREELGEHKFFLCEND